jgi:hypothetical protein
MKARHLLNHHMRTAGRKKRCLAGRAQDYFTEEESKPGRRKKTR